MNATQSTTSTPVLTAGDIPRMVQAMKMPVSRKDMNPALQRPHVDLLNSLAQPLPAIKALRRELALKECRAALLQATTRRLDDMPELAATWHALAEKYTALYKFTPEELNAVT